MSLFVEFAQYLMMLLRQFFFSHASNKKTSHPRLARVLFLDKLIHSIIEQSRVLDSDKSFSCLFFDSSTRHQAEMEEESLRRREVAEGPKTWVVLSPNVLGNMWGSQCLKKHKFLNTVE